MNARLAAKLARTRSTIPEIRMLGDGLDAILIRIDRDPEAIQSHRLLRYLRARIANPPLSDWEIRKANLRVIIGTQFQNAWLRGVWPDLRRARKRAMGVA